MTSVYDVLKFDNPDGGVWKQGFPITTSDEEWKGRKLKGMMLSISLSLSSCFLHENPGIFLQKIAMFVILHIKNKRG